MSVPAADEDGDSPGDHGTSSILCGRELQKTELTLENLHGIGHVQGQGRASWHSMGEKARTGNSGLYPAVLTRWPWAIGVCRVAVPHLRQ